jgi:hypothetical protein
MIYKLKYNNKESFLIDLKRVIKRVIKKTNNYEHI